MAKVTGEQKLKAREELGVTIVRCGDIIRSAQSWQAKGEFYKISAVNKALQSIISTRRDFSQIKSQWKRFYKEVFGIRADFSQLTVPEADSVYSLLVINYPKVTLTDLHSGGKDPQLNWKYTDQKLDDVIDWQFGRDAIAQKQAYIVRVRANNEADEDMKNISAKKIDTKSINTITLKERLLLGRFLWWSEQVILDKKFVTLCSGSRFTDGHVPSVDWDDGEVIVNWYHFEIAFDVLRARRAVSLPF